MNSFDGCEARSARFRNVALPPLSWLVRIRYGLGFAAARESAGECGNSGQGKSDVLRVALIWVLQGRLACEAKLGALKPKLRQCGYAFSDRRHCSR